MSVTFDGNYTIASLDLIDSRRNAKDYLGDVPCTVENGASFGASTFDIGGKKIKFYCSQIGVDGIQLVRSLLSFRCTWSVCIGCSEQKEFENMIHEASTRGLGLVMGAMIALAISVLCFLWIVVKAKGREVHLCLKLIKKMEATQQAERKSRNKSLAFARASHDMRAALHRTS
ncbi:Histidine kinase CKI1-like protein [Drosera capensis]